MNTFTKIIIGIILGAIAMFMYMDTNNMEPFYDYPLSIDADSYSTVMGTGSMEPWLHKGDTLYYKKLDPGESLWLGDIYVYQGNDTSTVIHRLIGFADDDGQELIFKGDNNFRADEIVSREDVLYKLVGVCFEGYCDE